MSDESTPPSRSSGSTPHAATSHAAPAISHWIDASAERHYLTLIASTIFIGIANLLGAAVDVRVYGLMGVWIVANAVMSRWAARPSEYDSRLRRYAGTLVLDVLFLGVAYYYLAATQYLGAVMFAYMVQTATAALPRSWAISIATLIVLVYSSLVVLAVYGVQTVVSPIGLPPATGNRLFVVAGIVSVVLMAVLLMHLRAHPRDGSGIG